jgi:hypothetical protein
MFSWGVGAQILFCNTGSIDYRIPVVDLWISLRFLTAFLIRNKLHTLADIGKIAILACRKKLSKKILIFEIHLVDRVLMLGRVFAATLYS